MEPQLYRKLRFCLNQCSSRSHQEVYSLHMSWFFNCFPTIQLLSAYNSYLHHAGMFTIDVHLIIWALIWFQMGILSFELVVERKFAITDCNKTERRLESLHKTFCWIFKRWRFYLESLLFRRGIHWNQASPVGMPHIACRCIPLLGRLSFLCLFDRQIQQNLPQLVLVVHLTLSDLQ